MSTFERVAGRFSPRLANYLRYDRIYHPGGDRVFWSIFDSFYWMLMKLARRFAGKKRMRSLLRPIGLEAAFERIHTTERDRLLLRRTHRGVIRDIFDREIYTRFGLDKGDWVIDVGAHWGAFTLWASRRVGPDGHIVAIEPDPRNILELRRNIARNGLTNVTVIEAGMWDTSGSGGMTAGRHAAQMEAIDESGEGIALVTLDEVVKRHARKFPRLVKLDVEGAELRVLRGGGETLREGADFAMEVHPKDVDAEAVEAHLADAGYRMESDRGEDRSDMYILWATRRGDSSKIAGR